MRKMCSDSILDLGKCPNQKTHESESACFPVGALSEDQTFCQMACIYLLNSHEGPQSLDFVITPYSYPLFENCICPVHPLVVTLRPP